MDARDSWMARTICNALGVDPRAAERGVKDAKRTTAEFYSAGGPTALVWLYQVPEGRRQEGWLGRSAKPELFLASGQEIPPLKSAAVYFLRTNCNGVGQAEPWRDAASGLLSEHLGHEELVRQVFQPTLEASRGEEADEVREASRNDQAAEDLWRPGPEELKAMDVHIRGTTAELKRKVANVLEEVRERKAHVRELISPCEELYGLWLRHEVHVPDGEAEMLEDLLDSWKELRQFATIAENRITRLQVKEPKTMALRESDTTEARTASEEEKDAEGQLGAVQSMTDEIQIEALGEAGFSKMFEDQCPVGNWKIASSSVSHLRSVKRELLVSRNLPVTEGISEFLIEDFEAGEWTLQGLPRNNCSLQNEIMPARARRYPVLVDPHCLGKNQIVCREHANEMKGTVPNNRMPRQPLIYMSLDENNPGKCIEGWENEKKIRMRDASMGLEIVARNSNMDTATMEGQRIELVNTHLGTSRPTEVKQELDEAGELHIKFPLLDAARPHTEFPISLAQMGNGVANEATMHIRAGPATSDRPVCQEVARQIEWRQQLPAICFLHSVMQKHRKHAGPTLWKVPYDFDSQSESSTPIHYLKNCSLDRDSVSAAQANWNTVGHLVSQDKGRADDGFDELPMNMSSEQYFGPGAFTDDCELIKDLRPGFSCRLPAGPHLECCINNATQMPGKANCEDLASKIPPLLDDEDSSGRQKTQHGGPNMPSVFYLPLKICRVMARLAQAVWRNLKLASRVIIGKFD